MFSDEHSLPVLQEICRLLTLPFEHNGMQNTGFMVDVGKWVTGVGGRPAGVREINTFLMRKAVVTCYCVTYSNWDPIKVLDLRART